MRGSVLYAHHAPLPPRFARRPLPASRGEAIWLLHGQAPALRSPRPASEARGERARERGTSASHARRSLRGAGFSPAALRGRRWPAARTERERFPRGIRSPGDGAACLVVDAHDFQNPVTPPVEEPIRRKRPRANYETGLQALFRSFEFLARQPLRQHDDVVNQRESHGRSSFLPEDYCGVEVLRRLFCETNPQRRMASPSSIRSSSAVNPSPRSSERAASPRPASSSAVKVGTSSTDCRTYLPDGNDLISSGSCVPSKFRTTVMEKGYLGQCPPTTPLTPLTRPLPGARLSPRSPASPLPQRSGARVRERGEVSP